MKGPTELEGNSTRARATLSEGPALYNSLTLHDGDEPVRSDTAEGFPGACGPMHLDIGSGRCSQSKVQPWVIRR